MGREWICIPIFIILLIVIFAAYYVSRYEIHPPIIEFQGKDIAFISMYEGDNRYSSSPYRKYKFIRNKKGKWKYDFEHTKKTVIGCLIVALAVPVFLLFCTGFKDVLLVLIISSFMAVMEGIVFLGGRYLLTLEPYIVLMRYLRKKGIKKTGSEIQKNNKNDKRSAKNIGSKSQKDNKYENADRIIKHFLKVFVSVLWFGILCLLLIPYVIFGFALYTTLTGKELLTSSVFSMSAIFGMGLFLFVWIFLRKTIMGDRSCYVPISTAEKRKKYSPEKLLGKLKDSRSNVILLKSKQGQVRIYGSGDTQVLEIRKGKKDDLKIFHMINTDTDSIVPVTDNTPTVIENKWHEKFPVRKHWLVNEEDITAFLMKLYTDKDLQAAMEGFSFEDTTEEINNLTENDAYIVPEIPVDWPAGGIKSNMGQAWMRRKEARVQRALEVLSET